MEIAVFGGTFNPPTRAHQAIMEASLKLEFIDQLWVMPSGQRVDKTFATDDSHRLNLLELALAEMSSEKESKVIDFEIGSAKLTRTVDTVKYINRMFPDYSFWYIFGMDSYNDMPNWHGGEDLRSRLNMIIVPRHGHRTKISDNKVWLPIKGYSTTSSSEVRMRISNDQSIEDLVCSGVASYINSNNLYR